MNLIFAQLHKTLFDTFFKKKNRLYKFSSFTDVLIYAECNSYIHLVVTKKPHSVSQYLSFKEVNKYLFIVVVGIFEPPQEEICSLPRQNCTL